MSLSPFIYGRAVKPENFLNREKIVSSLISRILTGQSSAVVGHPHTGKTSLFLYLTDAAKLKIRLPDLPKDFSGKFIFSYLNCQIFDSSFDLGRFWQQALAGVKDKTVSIKKAYKALEAKAFSPFELDNFFKAVYKEGHTLVLLLDELDTLLAHPKLNDPAFYGCLRHLTSLVDGISLITATRCSLDSLNRNTQKINPHGSPYFNTLTEYRLGALPPEAAGELLDRGKERFSPMDRGFIEFVSGRHPFLMQLAASVLWDMEKYETSYEAASEEIYRQAEAHFAETWRNFTLPERKVAAAIALNQIPKLVEGRRFKHQKLIKNMSDYTAELRRLKATGILKESGSDDKTKEWEIAQNAFLWWLADEIKRNTREDNNFNQWITSQQFDGLLTKEDKARWKKAAGKAGGFIKDGIGGLIKKGIDAIPI